MEGTIYIILVMRDRFLTNLIDRVFNDAEGDYELEVLDELDQVQSRLERSGPKLVIVDLFIWSIRELESLPDLSSWPCPVVVLSEYPEDKFTQMFRKAGAADFVLKSSDAIMKLPEVVERVMGEA